MGLRSNERLTAERVEEYVRRFGPITTRQLHEVFGVRQNRIADIARRSSHLTSAGIGEYKSTLWTYQEEPNADDAETSQGDRPTGNGG